MAAGSPFMWMLDVLVGLIVAGMIAPLVLLLPERLQGTGSLLVIAAVCVVGTFVLHTYVPSLRKPNKES